MGKGTQCNKILPHCTMQVAQRVQGKGQERCRKRCAVEIRGQAGGRGREERRGEEEEDRER